MRNKIVIGILAVVVVVLATMYFAPTKTDRIVERVVEKVGATPGTDFSSPEYCFNGLCKKTFAVKFRQATTTPVIQTSPNATSTGQFWCRIDTASTSATVWTAARSTTVLFATTTPISPDVSLAANARGYFMASSTDFAPSTTFVLGARGGDSNGDKTPTGFVPVGACGGEWIYPKP